VSAGHASDHFERRSISRCRRRLARG
jgi:hypothetical protein